MSEQHPLTPPPELVQQWDIEGRHQDYCTVASHIAARAAQWGADQELKACVEWVEANAPGYFKAHEQLRTARRPKPITKAEAMRIIDENILDSPARIQFSLEEIQAIRRALEALPDD